MKKYYVLFFITLLTIFSSCESEQEVFITNDTISFRLYNYTDRSFESGELFIGGFDSNGDFVPTESIDYSFVPSKLSPTDTYTNLDNCVISCGNEGLIDGYHYFTQNGEFFVRIPFSSTNNIWSPNLDDVLAISDNMAFMLRLPDGSEEMIGGFNIRTTLIDNEVPVNAVVRMYIRDSGIEGGTIF